MDKVKVFVVDDHSIFKKGLLTQLKEFKFVKITGEASNGREFLELIEKDVPDLVFMDIKMPEMNGIEATQAAVKKYPDIKIIALTMYGEEEYLQNMLDAGAKAFLLKNVEKGDIEKAINAVMDGKSYFSEELLTILTNKFIQKETKHEKITEIISFSRREIEVLQLICQGYTNMEIGNMLFISQRTVDGHRANLLSKVGAKNTVGLVTYAIKNKIVII